MASELSLPGRLVKVLVPTEIQAALSLVIALILLIGIQAERVIGLLHLDPAALDASKTELHARFSQLLTSSIASSAALITFWATVGLVAYLVCWGAYNLLIEARNEVTLRTEYTNHGRWRGLYEVWGIKALGAVSLICFVALLKPGLALWLALIAPLLHTLTVTTFLMALLATLGLATQLYLIMVGILLTFSAWYRPGAFTDIAE